RWPLVGRLIRAAGTIFIDRNRPSTLPGTVREIARSLRGGDPIAVFPEGTTSCGRSRGRFRPATFQAAIDAGAPVIPVALSYHEYGEPSTLPAFVGDTTMLTSLFRVVTAGELTVCLTVLPHIIPSGDRKSLAAAAEAAIAAELARQAGGGGLDG